MICPRCGAPNSESAGPCRICGWPAREAQSALTRKRIDKPHMFYAALLMLAIAGGVVVGIILWALAPPPSQFVILQHDVSPTTGGDILATVKVLNQGVPNYVTVTCEVTFVNTGVTFSDGVTVFLPKGQSTTVSILIDLPTGYMGAGEFTYELYAEPG